MEILTEIPSDLHILPMFVILIAFLCLSWSYYYFFLSRAHEKKHKSPIPTNWPIVGMLPAVVRNSHRLHEYGTEVLNESGGTFQIKGPNVNIVLTSDPANVQYVLCKNFSNYPRGPEFGKIFDILGDGIFNAEDELWEIHRKVTLSIQHHPDYNTLLREIMLKKMANSLLPILGDFANTGVEFDMQDILDRFTFDVFAKLILDDDPGSLSPGLPNIPCQWGYHDVEKALVHRHVFPESCWKLQKWLNLGMERKLAKAWEAVDQYIYLCIEKKPELFTSINHVGMQFNTMAAFLEAYKTIGSSTNSNSCPPITKKFLRDVIYSLMAAGKETISTALAWFFFLVARNPSVEAKILQEIEDHLTLYPAGGKNRIISNVDEFYEKLVYLHGALCETLRLFPPVALQHRTPSKPDILPSGVRLNGDTKLVLSFYSMGRMESIWGEDCLEFKPERWITEQGRIKHQPSFKFVAFNAGPRACLGKDVTFLIMKMVIVSITCNYHVILADDHPVSPADSVLIPMKHGLKATLLKKI